MIFILYKLMRGDPDQREQDDSASDSYSYQLPDKYKPTKWEQAGGCLLAIAGYLLLFGLLFLPLFWK